MVRSDLASCGRDVLGRHRDRLHGRRVHHRRLGPGRERRPGRGRRRRVLRPQADLPARLSLRAAPHARRQEDQDGLRRGAHPRAGGQPADERGGARRFCLTDEQVLQLADYAIRIEDHYSGAPAGPRRWTSSGPWMGSTTSSTSSRRGPRRSPRSGRPGVIEEYVLKGKGEVLARGRAVGTRVAAGRARLVKDPRQLHAFRDGEVLVADTTTPDWEPVMKRAAAIVTNRGGRTCHAAIVARELGIPAVVGAESATDGGRGRGRGHRLLRRGRHGPGLRRPGAVRGPADGPRHAGAARDPGHDQSRQPRARLRPLASSRPTGSASPGSSSSSTSTSRRIRWRCSIPIAWRTRRRGARSRP